MPKWRRSPPNGIINLFQGFYDRDKLFWKEIADTMLITGAAPPGGGRSEVTPRFVRHFNVFCVPQASTTAMQLIFSSMLKVQSVACSFPPCGKSVLRYSRSCSAVSGRCREML